MPKYARTVDGRVIEWINAIGCWMVLPEPDFTNDREPLMAWNFEKGCEEPNPYTAVTGGTVLTPRPGPVIDPERAREDQAEMVSRVHAWQQNESWLKNDSGPWRKKVTEAEVIASWERAEMAIAGWQNHSKIESFRAGYLEWLAKGTQVADQVTLTDLQIEELPMLERVVAKGYRELAKTEHPDAGGSDERFDKLRTAKLQLDRLLVEMKDILEG